MDNPFSINKTLEKQLQLLSERSHDETISIDDLCKLTQAMAALVALSD